MTPSTFSSDVVTRHTTTITAAMAMVHLNRILLPSLCGLNVSSVMLSNSVLMVQFCFLFLLCRCLIPASRTVLPIDSTTDMEAMTRARPSRIAGITSHQGIVIMSATLSTMVPETAPIHRTKRVNEVIIRKILRILAMRAIPLVGDALCFWYSVIVCWAFLPV